MKNFITLLFWFLLFFSKAAFAQINCRVVGIVTDSNKKAMNNVTVRLYSTTDSLHTSTDEKGYFSFSKIHTKQITVHISAIGFNTYMAKYDIKPDMQEMDIGRIILSGGEITLPDIVIKAKPVAIKYMQDTIEYDARAFNVQQDDRVKDLLKQLPGVEVDEDENVTAMGKAMTKLRVNGQDFFTNNVKDFISKLPAEIVAKIQVIDDFGDKANFTGIKNGEPIKMLNIVTKPGMDNGQFGGLSLTAGTNRQIGGNGSGQFWKGSKQISSGAAYNIADNGAGLTQGSSASLGLNNKIGKTVRFGANYRYNGSTNKTNTMQIVETVSPLGKLNSQLTNFNQSANQGHNLSFNLNQTTKSIFLTSSSSINYNRTESIINSLNYQKGFANQDFNNNSQNSNSSPNLQTNLEVSKKLKKNTISGNFAFSSYSNRSDQNILTHTTYYNASGILEKDSVLNRSVYNHGSNKQFTLGLSYSFFLKKDTVFSKSLSLNYSGSANIAESELQTYVINPMSHLPVKVDSLSLLTQNAFINQSLDLSYQQSGKKNRLSAGLNLSPNLVRNNFPELNSVYNNYYINISPGLNYSKTLDATKQISFSYNGRNNNPSIGQIQPVKNTRNLQNIIIGNPNLKSSFSNSLSSNFNYFGKKSNISFQSGLSLRTVRNEIVTNTILIPDTLGAYKQETRFENVNGNYHISGNYNLNIPFDSRRYVLSLTGNIGYSRKAAVINYDKTFNKGFNLSQGLNGSLNIKKFTAHAGLSYSMSSNNDYNSGNFLGSTQNSYNLLLNTGQSFFTTRSFNSNISASLSLKNFRFSFNGNYALNCNTNNSANITSTDANTKTQSINFGTSGNGTVFKSWNFNFSGSKTVTKGFYLSNVNPLIINLGVGKSFLKSKALSCSINVNDLLNEGNNISQSVLGNSIIESRSNQVMRVITFGLSYNISTFGGKVFKLRTD